MIPVVARLIGLVFLALGTVLAAPAAASRAPAWSHASSDHFEVFYAGNEKAAREVAAAFETYETFLEHLLKVQKGWRPRTRLVVFSNLSEYKFYKPKSNVDAYWLGTPDGDFIVLQSFDADAPTDALHELAHLIIARTGAAYPLWINEGLAQYYSTLRINGGKLRLGVELPEAMAALRRSAGMFSLDRVFALHGELPPGTTPALEGQFYAASWALVHMLSSGEEYRGRFAAFLAAVAGGTAPPEALASTYGKPAAVVNADFRRYVSRFKVDSTSVDAPIAAPPNVTVGAADEFDAAVTLGSILGWQQGHEDEGRAVFDVLEKDAPNRLRLVEARGLLEYYTRRCEPARAYLQRALDLGSTNPNVLRAYANLMTPFDALRYQAVMARAAGAAAPMTPSAPTIVMSACGGS